MNEGVSNVKDFESYEIGLRVCSEKQGTALACLFVACVVFLSTEIDFVGASVLLYVESIWSKCAI